MFIVENGKALKRTVTRNKAGVGNEVEIRKGLMGGEVLIVSPPESLQDGTAVKTTDARS